MLFRSDKKQLEELMDRDGLIDKRYKVAEYHLYSLSGFTDWVKGSQTAPLPRGASGEEGKLYGMPRPLLDRRGGTP